MSLANRVITAPLTRARANPDTRVTILRDAICRSSAGLVIGEATAMSDMGHGWMVRCSCTLYQGTF